MMCVCVSVRARRPDDDDQSVEDVEADADVGAQSVGDDLEQHLDGEQSAEEYVAVLEDLSQRRRLDMH